ncbi:MAG: efflux RND transporter permease subunit, partial [Desulfovibrio sp.]|nr:efflux RND transporter permease subunit [Desulfovibrio sp.]
MAITDKPNVFLRRPILSAVISIVITLVGALSILALPIAQYPDLVPPTVNVSATYPGASAETISSTVLAPLEVNINGVENMLYMTSTAASGSGTGQIQVTFYLGTDPDMAMVNVNNKVNLAQTQLPEEVRRQGVSVTKRSPAVLQFFCVYSPDGRYDEVVLANWMKINMVDELKRVTGVGDCTVFGSRDYSMRVWLQPDKLAKYGITINEVTAAIQDQNSQFAPGRLGAMPVLAGTQLDWQIDTLGRLVTPEQFGEIIIRTGPDSAMLRLKDIARIELGGQDYSVGSKFNGSPASMGAVYLLPGANAIATGDRVVQRLKEIGETMPDGMAYTVVVDTNDFVMESIHEVVQTLFEALLLVMAVVYVFLQNWRATLIPCVAVPISIIGTFAGLYALNFSINTLTLFALVLCIGLVVDDAIVVLENVERIIDDEHLSPLEATAKGMNEITPAVVGIVFCLCSVFIPIAFIGGLAGQMYKQFAITIAISVTLSGIVALTLTPALCALLLKERAPNYKPPKVFRWFDYGFGKVTRWYLRAVRWVKNNGGKAVTLVILMCVGIWYLFKILPGGLVPNEDQGYILGMGMLDDGASLNRTEKVGEVINEFGHKIPIIKNLANINGIDITTGAVKSNYTTFFAVLVPWKDRSGPQSTPDYLTKQMMGVTMMQPEAVVLGFTPPPISGMSTTGGFEGYLQMRGDGTLNDLEAQASAFVAEAMSVGADGQRKYPAIGSIQNLFSTGSPQLYANLDRDRCKDMGINVSDVFTAMSGVFGGLYVNDFNYMGRTFQVRLQSESQFRMLPEDLADVFVANNKGEMVPLTAIMTLERRTAPQVVERYNVFPAAHIMGTPADGYSSGQALDAMEAVSRTLPADYALGWVGSALQEKLAKSDSGMIFALALVMVFLILAAQYESWSLPISVLTAVPFGVFGALLATYLRGLENDVYFQVALVTIIGLSAKNSILIVEFAVEAWRNGRSLDVAAMFAARVRFRP